MSASTAWFDFHRLDDGVTLIVEPNVHRVVRCNIWHVRGRNADLLVDSGLGLVSLRRAAANLFEQDIIAIATHSL